jgi:hypothetical protein
MSITARHDAEAFLKRMDAAGVTWDLARELRKLTTDERENLAILLAERAVAN